MRGRENIGIRAYGYDIQDFDGIYSISVGECIREIVEGRCSGEDIGVMAYRFHKTIVDLTSETCRMLRDKCGINKVAVSGGVFQNGVLFGMLMRALRYNGFEVFYNTIVPPNDGGISLGQAFAGLYWEV
jgi:hydrogenase maturation protein HypF